MIQLGGHWIRQCLSGEANDPDKLTEFTMNPGHTSKQLVWNTSSNAIVISWKLLQMAQHGRKCKSPQLNLKLLDD